MSDFNALREQVFEANMELKRRGLVLYTWGNVSGVCREEGVIAIKPSGVPYEDLRPEDMVLMSLETGEVVAGSYMRPSSDALTHIELYREFPEIGGVTHTHSTYATTRAQVGFALRCYGTTHADYFYGDVPCTRMLRDEEVAADYEKNTGKLIVETMHLRGFKNALHMPGIFVKGHGPFTWGISAGDSVHNAAVLEQICVMAQGMLIMNPETLPLPNEIRDKHFMRKHGPDAYYGQK